MAFVFYGKLFARNNKGIQFTNREFKMINFKVKPKSIIEFKNIFYEIKTIKMKKVDYNFLFPQSDKKSEKIN